MGLVGRLGRGITLGKARVGLCQGRADYAHIPNLDFCRRDCFLVGLAQGDRFPSRESPNGPAYGRKLRLSLGHERADDSASWFATESRSDKSTAAAQITWQHQRLVLRWPCVASALGRLVATGVASQLAASEASGVVRLRSF